MKSFYPTDEYGNKITFYTAESYVYDKNGRRLTDKLSEIKNTLDKTASKEALNVEKSRIDVVTSLQNGSTTGDAELADIRVQYNGLISETAGNAIRNQFKDVFKDIGNQNEYKKIPDSLLKIVDNKFVDKYGATYDDKKYRYIRCDHIHLYRGRTLKIITYGADDACFVLSDDNWNVLKAKTVSESIPNYIPSTYSRIEYEFEVPLNASQLLVDFAYNDYINFEFFIYESIQNTIKKTIGNILTPEMFGAIGDGDTDDTVALQTMLLNDGIIIFPNNRIYSVSSQLIDEKGHNITMNSSFIKWNGTDTDEFIFKIHIPGNRVEQRIYKYQLNLKCNHLSSGCLISNSIGNKFELLVHNAHTALEMTTTGTTFENTVSLHADSSSTYENIAANILTNDNEFKEIYTVNYKICVVNTGTNHYGIIHPWLGIDGIKAWTESICIKEVGSTLGCSIDYLYNDTMRYGVVSNSYAKTHISSLMHYINFEQVDESIVLDNKCIIFSGNGSLHIGLLQSFDDFSKLQLTDSVSAKKRLIINAPRIIEYSKSAPIEEICYSISVDKTYKCFWSLPTIIQNAYTDSSIELHASLTDVGIIGFECSYYAVPRRFYAFVLNPNPGSWKYTELMQA